MRKIVVLLGIIAFTSLVANAQYNVHWRKIRHEVSIGAGTVNFFGDLGGANTIGTHFVKDFDFKASRYMFSAGYGYKVAEAWTVNGSVYYGRVYGEDQFTLEENRHSRDLSFRSPIIDVSATVHYSLVKERYGHRYDLRRSKGTGNLPNFYIFTGVSVMYFNPKAQFTDGNWYALQPLGTEGQGIIPTREKYKRVTMAIPAGFGLNYIIDRNFGIGFEFGARYTFSDYIDDVSNTYVDPSIFSDPMAQYFSDPSGGTWVGTGAGQQRGQNKYTDSFLFLTIKATYKLRPGNPGMPKF